MAETIPLGGMRQSTMQDLFTELPDLSARKTAEVLKARGIPTSEGGKCT